jgi:YD repeat-containing protein
MITSQSYEADGQTRAIIYANGVTTNFAYSPTRRWLMEMATRSGAAQLLLSSQYSRDLTGRIATITGQAGGFNTWAYTYDDLGRLTTATNAGDAAQSEVFTYAANDNLLSRSRNPFGALAPAGVAPYVYTYPAGTGIRPHTPTSVAGRAFSYDANLHSSWWAKPASRTTKNASVKFPPSFETRRSGAPQDEGILAAAGKAPRLPMGRTVERRAVFQT